MSRRMRTFVLCIFSCVILSIAFVHAPTPSYGFEITIQMAPSTLNMESQSQVVTVHTSIAFGSVVGGSVTHFKSYNFGGSSKATFLALSGFDSFTF